MFPNLLFQIASQDGRIIWPTPTPAGLYGSNAKLLPARHGAASDPAGKRACEAKPKSEPLTLSQIGDAPVSLKRALTQGLVSFAPDGNVEPALAERWIITDDGLSYIFRIRDTVWSNGQGCTSP
jgi:oligopeptide transport system substrate-binding protein